MASDFGKLVYNGEREGVHQWESLSGLHYYWHPDWLHIAEDATGQRPKVSFDDAQGRTQTDAEKALIKHLANKK